MFFTFFSFFDSTYIQGALMKEFYKNIHKSEFKEEEKSACLAVRCVYCLASRSVFDGGRW